jgi:hypothetical protein
VARLSLAIAVLTASPALAGTAAAATVTTVMSGLDNPRGTGLLEADRIR